MNNIRDKKYLKFYREIAKKINTIFFKYYNLNRIYSIDLMNYNIPSFKKFTMRRITDKDVAYLEYSEKSSFRNRLRYAGKESYGFGLWKEGILASICWFWTNKRFHETNIWSIKDKEAILVDLFTREGFRGQGLASVLIRFASYEMKCLGFEKLYTWIWHSNFPSISAFQKAGWKYVAFVIELLPFGMKKPLHFVWKREKK